MSRINWLQTGDQNTAYFHMVAKGTLEGRYTARVSWKNVTIPKDEGGLGLKNLDFWNTTCTIKLMWLLLFITESIWVA